MCVHIGSRSVTIVAFVDWIPVVVYPRRSFTDTDFVHRLLRSQSTGRTGMFRSTRMKIVLQPQFLAIHSSNRSKSDTNVDRSNQPSQRLIPVEMIVLPSFRRNE